MAGEPAPGRARLVLFGLLLAASLAVLLANATTRQRQAATAGQQLDLLSTDMVAAFGAARLRDPQAPPADPVARQTLETALRRYRASLQDNPDSAPLRGRVGVLLGVLRGREAAWEWLRARPLPHPEVWRAAYAPGTLTPAELSTALEALPALPLAWYSDLVRVQLYEKAGQPARAREVLDRLRERLQPDLARMTLLVSLVAAGLLLGMLVLGVLGGQALLGQLRRAEGALPFSTLSTRTLVEAFILWFFVLSAGSWGLRQILGALPGPRPLLSAAGQMLLLLMVQLAAAGAGWALLTAGARRRRPRPTPHADLFSAAPSSTADAAGLERVARNIAWGVLAYLAAVPLLLISAALLSRLLPNVPTPPNPAVNLALSTRGPVEWVLLVAMVVVAAPVFEELFFRGVLYPALRRRWRAPFAIGASAVLFALVHPQLPLGFLPILVLGSVLAGVLELRRSLVPCTVAHMLNNGVAILMVSLLRMP